MTIRAAADVFSCCPPPPLPWSCCNLLCLKTQTLHTASRWLIYLDNRSVRPPSCRLDCVQLLYLHSSRTVTGGYNVEGSICLQLSQIGWVHAHSWWWCFLIHSSASFIIMQHHRTSLQVIMGWCPACWRTPYYLTLLSDVTWKLKIRCQTGWWEVMNNCKLRSCMSRMDIAEELYLLPLPTTREWWFSVKSEVQSTYYITHCRAMRWSDGILSQQRLILSYQSEGGYPKFFV